jgi:DNA excision repair protein ERCC-2
MYNIHVGDPMKEIAVSVRDIVELIYGSGNISTTKNLMERAKEGTEIHKLWQDKYLESDQKEVFCQIAHEESSFSLTISGRIDGILNRDGVTILEEIKSTHLDLDMLEEDTIPSHFAQAKMYAYIYVVNNDLKKLNVTLTYIQVDSHESRQFERSFTKKQLENFYNKTINKYINWQEQIFNHENERQKSIVGLEFPFEEYRLNQREMMAYIYRNILNHGKLYIEAPTGIGKTIAALFSGLKAINKPRQKLFYNTAKNDGKRVVIDTVKLLEKNGLIAKTVEITAKDTMCFLPKRDCDPEVCKYANGYYNRIFKTINDVYANESLLTKEKIKIYAKKHTVCPFELSLDLSNYADIIVCDYNYVFDPLVHLIRYFEDDSYSPILLCDEAHNLVDRSRRMYSASLNESLFVQALEVSQYLKPNPSYEIQQVLEIFAAAKISLLEVDFIKQEEVNPTLILLLRKLSVKLDKIFTDDKIRFAKTELQDFYFQILRFLKINDFYNDDFVYVLERYEEDIIISINCLNASYFINQTIDNHTEAATFFSATLTPIFYYKSLITANEGDDISLISDFSQNNLLLLAVDDVSTRYKDRDYSLDKIVQATKALVNGKKGNYILFFPSYAYLKKVENILLEEIENVNFISQRRNMFLQEREEMMSIFADDSDVSQVFLFVMGGIFGESIDLIGDLLSGVLIVGVGLPAIAPFNNILKSHYDLTFSSGFDYAYTYPGLNKVIQAVGRVLRTKTDKGVAILLDDRFTSRKYLSLYPKFWSHLSVCNDMKELGKMIEAFWSDENEISH